MQLKDRGAWSRVNVWINPKDLGLRSYTFANSGYIQIPATIAGHVGTNTLLVWKPLDKVVIGCVGLTTLPTTAPNPSVGVPMELDAHGRGYVYGIWTNSGTECFDIPASTLQWVSAPDGTNYPYVGKASAQPILSCKVCGTFSEYAVPNQADQVSFVCYSCRR
jgi:hypothetical protein